MSREILEFTNTTQNNGAIQVIEVNGAITLSNLFPLQSALREPNPAKALVFVLSGVPYMDSAGIGVILNAHVSCQKNGRSLVLVGVTDRVRQLLKVTKTESLFTCAATLDDARAQLLQLNANA